MYLVADIGTSSLKAAVIDGDGQVRGSARRSLGLIADGEGGFYSDPNEWRKAFASLAYELSSAGRPEAIALSGNGPTLVSLDTSGEPLGRASSWMDRRAVSEAERVAAVVGRRIDPSFYLPKAMRALASAGAGSIASFLPCPEYMAFALTGEARVVLPAPGYEAFFWNRSTLTALGLPKTPFPPFCRPGDRIGAVTVSASREFGLAQGLPVIASYPDFLAAIVGSACVEPGLACDRTGSSEALNLCASEPSADPSFLCLPHAVEGLWNLSGGVTTSGKALEWFASLVGKEGDPSACLAAAAESAPGAGGALFLPYLAGERAPLWDPLLRGAFLGLSLDHGKEELARAILESIGYGLKLTVERYAAAGLAPRSIRVSGSAARDRLLSRIKADVLDLPVEIPALADCELLGNACVCEAGLGRAASIREAAKRLYRTESIIEPDPGLRSLYDEGFTSFSEALASASLSRPGPG